MSHPVLTCHNHHSESFLREVPFTSHTGTPELVSQKSELSAALDHNRLEERSFRISDSCHREIGEKTLIQKARCACVHWKYVTIAI